MRVNYVYNTHTSYQNKYGLSSKNDALPSFDGINQPQCYDLNYILNYYNEKPHFHINGIFFTNFTKHFTICFQKLTFFLKRNFSKRILNNSNNLIDRNYSTWDHIRIIEQCWIEDNRHKQYLCYSHLMHKNLGPRQHQTPLYFPQSLVLVRYSHFPAEYPLS